MMINSNPSLRRMVEQYPEMRMALSDPNAIQQAMSAIERMGVGNT